MRRRHSSPQNTKRLKGTNQALISGFSVFVNIGQTWHCRTVEITSNHIVFVGCIVVKCPAKMPFQLPQETDRLGELLSSLAVMSSFSPLITTKPRKVGSSFSNVYSEPSIQNRRETKRPPSLKYVILDSTTLDHALSPFVRRIFLAPNFSPLLVHSSLVNQGC